MSITGLTDSQVTKLRKKYGKNELISSKKENIIIKIIHIVSEPMFLLLISAAVIYLLLGEPQDSIVMLVCVLGVIAIDVIQELKTDKTLEALKDLSEPKITVLRNSKKQEIMSRDLVPGDIMYIHEGIKIPADGFIVKCSGLKVDESSLTGESEGVWKISQDEHEDQTKDYWKKDYCYQGTLVVQGTGIIRVDKTGLNTEYGKISKNIRDAEPTKSPLQQQTNKLVKIITIVAFALFVLVTVLNYLNLTSYPQQARIVTSILAGITLAMAMIPEEYPVVLTVFLSMGTWRLAKKHSLVKKMSAIETLGAVTVLCVDKTGTITKNQMEIVEVTSIDNDLQNLARLMGLSCEEDTYDPMEIAMLDYAKKLHLHKKDLFSGQKLKDYPFSNDTKMVGKVWQKNEEIVLSAKGSPENILSICDLSSKEKTTIQNQIHQMQKNGLRVIAVASKKFSKKFSEQDLEADLTAYKLEYAGIVGLVDPPKEAVAKDIKKCYNAGVRVVMITGDNGVTASAIAEKIGMNRSSQVITGSDLDQMTERELQSKIKTVSIFSRVTPEHKMRIVKAFQKAKEVVAMTGDGVNDAAALKQADIGIAMGKRGSEVSREAADLILLDDNFTTIVDTIEDGRRIYDNIKKAIEYILAIHVPIALSALLAPLLRIPTADLLFLPIHVVLMEILIDPTCSIVFERQPAESNIMARKPRHIKESIITGKNAIKGLLQGLTIFAGSFLIYYSLVGDAPVKARTMGLLVIIFANIFLVQVNSSASELAIHSLKKLVHDKTMIIANLLVLIGVFIITYTPLNTFLGFQSLSLSELLITIGISFVSVFWYELVKIIKLHKKS